MTTAMRTSKVHKKCLEKIEELGLKSLMGVKGRSKLFDLIDNLPLTAPVDVMHQMYLGVGKVLLQVIVAKRAKKDMENINSMVANLEVRFFFQLFFLTRALKLSFFSSLMTSREKWRL